eukprot:SAG22_NODE_837_length_6911_cov_4.576629_1_plen_83_part_00
MDSVKLICKFICIQLNICESTLLLSMPWQPPRDDDATIGRGSACSAAVPHRGAAPEPCQGRPAPPPPRRLNAPRSCAALAQQ